MCRAAKYLLLAAILALIGFVPDLPAQQDTCGSRNIFVRVEDENRQPVTGLTERSFTAFMGKQVIAITSVEPAPVVKRIALLLDNSASMADKFNQHVLIGTAASLVERSPAGAQFFWINFSVSPVVGEPFTSDHERLANEIRQFPNKNPWKGPTSLFDAIQVSLTKVFHPSDEDSAVIVISDGDDNTSQITVADTERLVAYSGIRLFLVQLVSPGDTVSEMMQKSSGGVLEGIIQSAGGELFQLGRDYPPKPPHRRPFTFRVEKDYGNLPDIADAILSELSAGYVLKLSLPHAIGKVEALKLELSGDSSQKPPDYLVSYPKKLFPCAASTSNNKSHWTRVITGPFAIKVNVCDV